MPKNLIRLLAVLALLSGRFRRGSRRGGTESAVRRVDAGGSAGARAGFREIVGP